MFRSGVKVCGLAIPDLHTAGVRAGKHSEEPDTFDPPSLTTRSSDCERVASFLLPPIPTEQGPSLAKNAPRGDALSVD